MTLTVGSLFSGIGGIDLGLERAGMTVKWHSEIEPYACRVLKKHWPDVPNIGDITKVDWNEVSYVDVLAGGYPCQPFSLAGKRNGEHDPRHLWPHFRTAISVLRPRYALLENVRGHLSLGGLSVIGDLATIGYDCEWRIVSAASVGANHRRDRLIIVAYPNGSDTSDGRQRPALSCEGRSRGNDGGRSGSHLGEIGMGEPRENPGDVAYPNDSECRTPRSGMGVGRQEVPAQRVGGSRVFNGPGRCGTPMADTDSGRRVKCEPETKQVSWFGSGCERMANTDTRTNDRGVRGKGTNKTEVFSRGNIGSGIPKYDGRQWWETEPNVGRVVNGVPCRVDRLRGLGNAVVPQVAEVVGRLIMEHAQ